MRIPISTYRLQFGNGFGFREACDLAPYLHKLGITDVYASPIFKAKSGSLSGYDVTDPLHLNPELGSERDFNEFAAALKQHDLGLILDIVPNHMAAHPENEWWMDVLENGPCSPHAFYFDIDWDPSAPTREDKILLPVLGSPYGDVLERGELRLAFEERGLVVWYFDRKLPLDPKTYPAALSHRINEPASQTGLSEEDRSEFAALSQSFQELPARTNIDPEQIQRRYQGKERLKQHLWKLHTEKNSVRVFLDETIRSFNGQKGDPRSFDLMDELLSQQPYALCFWRVAREKINYRRFFDISDLVAIRTEDPEVFVNTHALTLQLLDDGRATGVRVDHIDGLNDPEGYLSRFKEHAPDRYLVVEKILCGDEPLPQEWPICGTTGYEFLGAVGRVLIDPEGLQQLDGIYRRFTKENDDFESVVYRQKKNAIEHMFVSEVFSLSLQLSLIAEQDRHARDLSPTDLRRALVGATACLPIYRTYIRSFQVGQRDIPFLERAIEDAQRRNPEVDGAVFDFLRRLFLLQFPASLSQESRLSWQRFMLRWQQFTGPAMAKGLEDSALYVYNRLISMNDVGGSSTASSVGEFHQFNCSKGKAWPISMNATSTHDNKRSEDVRARIHLLSEMAKIWERRLHRWQRWNARCKPLVGGVPAPSANEEIMIYQTMIGAWPIDSSKTCCFQKRLQAYVQKALREAKVNTSWVSPNQEYEDAVSRFLGAIVAPSPENRRDNRFLQDFLAFQEDIAFRGAIQSLTQVVLRLISPGVPDTYQGTELWNLRLVDPDNRRPVDFAKRQALLDEIGDRQPHDLLEKWQDGALKLYVFHKLLAFRREHPQMFVSGDYVPLAASGEREKHVIAFARHSGADWAVAVTPRLLVPLMPDNRLPHGKRVWRDTQLCLPENAPLRWSNILTGEQIGVSGERRMPVSNVLKTFPVALLQALPE